MTKARARLRANEAAVNAGPFQDWLNERVKEMKTAELADLIGFGGNATGEKRLYRYRFGRLDTRRGGPNGRRIVVQTDRYPRAVVEDALHRVRPGLFYDLYPEYRHELDLDALTLEPDAWCPFCEQMVTPIDGLCPFCVCEHGHLFREVGVTEDGYACIACLKGDPRTREMAEREVRRQAA
jgi:hypothetical protein